VSLQPGINAAAGEAILNDYLLWAFTEDHSPVRIPFAKSYDLLRVFILGCIFMFHLAAPGRAELL